jgi:hypothetical protein
MPGKSYATHRSKLLAGVPLCFIKSREKNTNLKSLNKNAFAMELVAKQGHEKLNNLSRLLGQI